MLLYSSTDTARVWENSRFILSERSDFHLIDDLSITFRAFAMRMLTSLSLDERLLPRYVKWSTNFKGLPHKMEIV